jgi:subtilisin family serine protease
MSLGGEPTDGTDPLSQAVNALTEQYGTLFVVSAGNSGVHEPVSSPGAADAALTVASVSKQDRLGDFSSRGPRTGDFAWRRECRSR